MKKGEKLKAYNVNDTWYLLAESPGKAKSAVCIGGVKFTDLSAKLFSRDDHMEEGVIYDCLCETCGRPCRFPYDITGRDINDPCRTSKFRCEFC